MVKGLGEETRTSTEGTQLVETNEASEDINNTKSPNLIDEIDFPPLEKSGMKHTGKTPQGDKIQEIIAQLAKTSGDNATKNDTKRELAPEEASETDLTKSPLTASSD